MDFDLTPTPAATLETPIADMSYRNYDGPLHSRAIRWWIVAFNGLRLLQKNVGFWVCIAFVCLFYFFRILFIYLVVNAPQAISSNFFTSDIHQKYAQQFFQAMYNQWLWWFLITLVVGAGSIAADNKANALIVYLSKPITKSDYLLGKWMGVFLTVYAVALAPALLLYAFCALSYRNQGFFTNEPHLLWRIVFAAAMPALVHASLITGISAWSKSPRTAGLAYAGVFFVTLALSRILWVVIYRSQWNQGEFVRNLSIQGIIDTLMQHIFHVTPSYVPGAEAVSPPALPPLLALAGAVIFSGIAAARYKIRAVEVVRG